MDTIPLTGRGGHRTRNRLNLAVFIAAGSLMSTAPVLAHNDGKRDGQHPVRACSSTARLVLEACRAEARDDHLIAKASCLNIENDDQRRECRHESGEETRENLDLCKQQFQARRDVCELLGEDRYDPDFEPDNFVDPAEIGNSIAPNMYFPLKAGNKWVYKSTYENEDGDTVTEDITVVVTDRTKLIEGVTCRVVNDLVEVDGEKVEDTDDWYAQDVDGNVWYCGEEVKDFETFDGDNPELPELVAIDGSFKVGRDGARPGMIMLAAPQVGDAYRQEVLLGEAEDYAEVISTSASETVPAASCPGNCLVTREGTPLEPDVQADKYYAPNVGCILEVEDGTRVELTEFYQAP